MTAWLILGVSVWATARRARLAVAAPTGRHTRRRGGRHA